ncbi:MAG TPA: hypothetical protein VLT32_13285 [Candidatus Sulfomarinibacteraceae bacterium]|nr:hypothetical protein [Candidatus Sulfomarinibacteraceae bacterium]
MPEPAAAPRHTAFDWRIYADATLAGLSALVPLPLVDVAFEAYFRRRMPGAIGRARGRGLADGARRRFGRGSGRLVSVAGCLALPLLLARYVVRKLWRKVVFIFAITDATSQVSAYWHRAYLLDHLVRAGHAGPEVDWLRAARVFERVLRETDTGPLTGLARQTVASSHRVLRLLVRAKRHGAAEEADSLAAILRSNWDTAEASLMAVAVRYNEAYARSLELEPPVVAPPPDAS